MKRFFGLVGWEVSVRAEHSDVFVGKCDRRGEYRKAWIKLNPAEHDDDDELLDTLAHEFLHVLLWPFDLYRNVTTQHIDNNTPDGKADNCLFSHAVEMMVGNLEVLWVDHLKADYLEAFTAGRLGG